MLERSPEQRCKEPELFIGEIADIVDEALSSGTHGKH